MAVPDGTPKEKYNRTYRSYNPNKLFGPPTQILGTVLKPLPEPPTP